MYGFIAEYCGKSNPGLSANALSGKRYVLQGQILFRCFLTVDSVTSISSATRQFGSVQSMFCHDLRRASRSSGHLASTRSRRRRFSWQTGHKIFPGAEGAVQE